jgi:small subunit ribosomal protein S16
LLRMRLTRLGAKKRPHYRVIVADSRAPRDGRHVEILGHYDPLTNPATIAIDSDRAVKWLQNGAQPSERVRILLRHSGVLKAYEDARTDAKRRLKEERALLPPRPPKPVRDPDAPPPRIVNRVERAKTPATTAPRTASAAATKKAAPKGGRTTRPRSK